MSTQPTNPPAFPTHSIGKEPGQPEFQITEGGMTLLDYFAGLAMQGWLSSYSDETPHPADDDCAPSLAKLSYDQAAAMLAERQRRGEAKE